MCAVLLIKTTSLGDVIHNLPVVNDIYRFNPDLSIDWCAESPFCALLKLHPHLRNIIPVALRKWRKNLFQRATWREWGEFKQKLQSEHYEKIIDSQGLIKSAWLSKMAKGKRCGFAKEVVKEKCATSFYDETFFIPRAQNAVLRNRQLAGAVLGYEVTTPPDYGLIAPEITFAWLPPKPYAVALSSSSRPDKMWQKESWQSLLKRFPSFNWVFLSGNEKEREHAQNIVKDYENALCAPFLDLNEAAALIARAAFVVGVDTGLTHLAAAFKTPAIALFLKSDPLLTGLSGQGFCQNLGGFNQNPSAEEVAFHLNALLFEKNRR